jgi:capsular exopolysaccharide synthesis family protein
MGRVDEAMRRAAARAPDVPAPTETAAGAFASESFPAEADLFRPETDNELAAPFGDVDALQQTPVEATGGLEETAPPAEAPPVVNGAAPGAMFERLDPTLAGKIVVDHAMKPAFREQYRRLAAALHQAQIERGIKVIMVVSAVASEGKTLTATNLALTLSESYHRQVLLVDGDLRRPSLHTVLNVSVHDGLSEGLFADAEPKLALHQLSPRLALLPAGRPMSDPMAGLTSERMRRIIEEARSAFDWVIVDTPPVALLPDGHLLASLGDGALLVVKAGGPSHALIQRAIDAIGRERVLGAILNKAEEVSGEGYYYRYDYRTRSSPAAP